MVIKLEGGGGKALMAWPLGEEFFFRLPFPRQIKFSADSNQLKSPSL